MGLRLFALTAAFALAWPAAAQPPWKARNLQYFPGDIDRPALIQRMREFSFSLGVRCQYCHAGGDGVSLEGVDFPSDDKPAKLKARAMLRMTDQINTTILPQLPSRAEPRVEVSCATCHHGLPLPKTLQTTLFEIAEKDGAAAAVARYRKLRNEDTLSGRYNFGEWEISELARRLVDAKDPTAAIAMLEMNGEFYPKSASIDFQLGELHRAGGDRAKALQRYKQALEKDPSNAAIKQRIAEMGEAMR
jgi:Photosynthetic reaction centre cytochrome C subunit